MLFHRQFVFHFQPTTLHATTLEIQPKKCTQIQKEWGTNLVWKWQHGVHLFNFATLIMIPSWSLQCFVPWTLTQMMDIGIFSTKWHRIIGIRCMKNSILEHISTTLGPTCKGRLFIGMFSIWKNCLRMCGNLSRWTSNSMVNLFTKWFKIIFSTKLFCVHSKSYEG